MSQQYEALIAAVERIPGFLFPLACAATKWLLDHQIARRYQGGLVEIGVFQGKYFSVLARSAQETGERLLGIDSFVYSDRGSVMAALQQEPDTRSAPVTVWTGQSQQVRPATIMGEIGGPARFVSVDGSHEATDVASDLATAAEILAEHGVIAIDDFLNPRALGVGEAAHGFMRARADLKPFALLGNKLFVCHAARQTEYKLAVERFFEDYDAAEGRSFRDLRSLGPDQVEQDLWGARLVVM